MSLPIEKLNKLISELQQLDQKDAEQAVVMLEDYITSKKRQNQTKPSDYFGFLKNRNINIEEESRKLREEWDRDF